MAQWIAYTHQGHAGFGTLTDDSVQVHTGDLFAQPQPTGEVLNLAVVHIGLPCDPSKFIGLWNNYHVQTAKQNLSIPAEPLYFIKAPSSYLAHKQKITSPATYDGRVVYESELGIVIGKTCKNISPEDAERAIFGYTCADSLPTLDGHDANARRYHCLRHVTRCFAHENGYSR